MILSDHTGRLQAFTDPDSQVGWALLAMEELKNFPAP